MLTSGENVPPQIRSYFAVILSRAGVGGPRSGWMMREGAQRPALEASQEAGREGRPVW